MKKLVPLIFVLLFLVSCKSDDDATISQCMEPYNIELSNLTSESASIFWENDNTSSSFKVEYGISGFFIGTGTSLDTQSPMLNLTNLSPSTTYDVYIQSVCSSSNLSMYSSVFSFTTAAPAVIPEFLPLLSQLNLFSGDLSDLALSPYVFGYDLNTRLYTDYSKKQRIISLPEGTSMQYDGNGLPIFPNGTVIGKTFYYNNNEQDLSQGKQIIETRILLRANNQWYIGNYVWNDDQSDAVLDDQSHVVAVSFINESGNQIDVDYEVPSNSQCITCHQSYGNITPIGPRLRSMNFNNQLQDLISAGHLTNAPNPSSIDVLPDWQDTTLSAETRTRAYFDMNCAHCHAPGGFHNETYFDAMDLRYETDFADSHIYEYRYSMQARLPTSIEGYSMPYLGVTIPHQEALDLIIPYLESLD